MKICYSLIVLFLFPAFTVFAQVEEKKFTPRFINGTVKNAVTGEAVPFASVMVKGTTHGFSTDSLGKFVLALLTLDPTTEIEISAVGYETGNFVFAEGDKPELVYNLSPATRKLDEVVVVAQELWWRRCGACILRVVKDYYYAYPKFPNNEVVVYPNPIPAGNQLQVSLQLKERGDYCIDLVDASGRVLWTRRMDISQQQNISIPTQSIWSPGVYMLRISGKQIPTVYNSKILIQ